MNNELISCYIQIKLTGNSQSNLKKKVKLWEKDLLNYIKMGIKANKVLRKLTKSTES